MSRDYLSEEDEHKIYKGLLDRLFDIADKESQERAWIHGDYSNYNIYSEIYMHFMSPCSDILKWPDLSEKQKDNLQKLYNMVESYEDYYPDRNKTDEEVCQDPKWHEIREFAKEVHDELKDLFKQ